MCTMRKSSANRQFNNFLPFRDSVTEERGKCGKRANFAPWRERERPPAKSYFSSTVGTDGRTERLFRSWLSTSALSSREKKLANTLSNLNHATRQTSSNQSKDSLNAHTRGEFSILPPRATLMPQKDCPSSGPFTRVLTSPFWRLSMACYVG